MVITMRNVKGFTLLEVMLVLLLMGMISVGVVMTLTSSGQGAQSNQWHAQRFSTLLQLAQDQALISNNEFGIEFNEQSYTFTYYDFSKRKWLPLVNSRINGHIQLPVNIATEYNLQGNVWGELTKVQQKQDNSPFSEQAYLVKIEGQQKETTINPHVLIMSSGEVTPFSYQFSNLESEQNKVTVKVSMNGQIELVSGLL